jgi:hypothetical protein
MLLRDQFFAFPDPANAGKEEGKTIYDAIIATANELQRKAEQDLNYLNTVDQFSMASGNAGRAWLHAVDPFHDVVTTRRSVEAALLHAIDPSSRTNIATVRSAEEARLREIDPFHDFDDAQKLWETAEAVESKRESGVREKADETIARIVRMIEVEKGGNYVGRTVRELFANSLFESIMLDTSMQEVVRRTEDTPQGKENGPEYLIVRYFMKLLEADIDKDFRELYKKEFAEFFKYEYEYKEGGITRKDTYNLLNDFLKGVDFGINKQGQIDENAAESLRKAKAISQIVAKNVDKYPPSYQLEMRYLLSLIKEAEDKHSYTLKALFGLDLHAIIQPGLLKNDVEAEMRNHDGRVRRLYGDLVQIARRMMLEVYTNDRTARLQDSFEQAVRGRDKDIAQAKERGKVDINTEKIFDDNIAKTFGILQRQYKLLAVLRDSVSDLFYGNADALKMSADPDNKDSARLSTIAIDYLKRGLLANDVTAKYDAVAINIIVKIAACLKGIPEFAEYVKLLDPKKRVFERTWSVAEEGERAATQLGVLLAQAEDTFKRGENPLNKNGRGAFIRRINAQRETMEMEDINIPTIKQTKGLEVAIEAVRRNLNAKRTAFGATHLLIREGATFFELDPIAQGMVSAVINGSCIDSAEINDANNRMKRTRADFETEIHKRDYITALYRDYENYKKTRESRYIYDGIHAIDWALQNAKTFYEAVFPGYEVPEINEIACVESGSADAMIETILTFKFEKKKFKYEKEFIRNTITISLKEVSGIIHMISSNPVLRDKIQFQAFKYFYPDGDINDEEFDRFKRLIPYVSEYTIKYFNLLRAFWEEGERHFKGAAAPGAMMTMPVAPVMIGAALYNAVRNRNVAYNRRGLFRLEPFFAPKTISPIAQQPPVTSPIVMKSGVKEGRHEIVTANITKGAVENYSGVGYDDTDSVLKRDLNNMITRVITLDGVEAEAKAGIKELLGDQTARRALLENKNIRIVEGNDRLMHFTESDKMITLDIDALLYSNDLLFMEFIHELLHARLAASPTRAGPVEEEIYVTTKEVELFLLFSKEIQDRILKALAADNDLDDKNFRDILIKAQTKGIDSVAIEVYVMEPMLMTGEAIWNFLNNPAVSRLPELESIPYSASVNPATNKPYTVSEHVYGLIAFEDELHNATGDLGTQKAVVRARKDSRIDLLSDSKIEAFVKYYNTVADSADGAKKLMLLRIALALHDIGKVNGAGEDRYASLEYSKPVVAKLIESQVITESEGGLILALIYLHDTFNTMHYGESVPVEINNYLEKEKIEKSAYYELSPLLYIFDVGAANTGYLSDTHLDNAIFLSDANNADEVSKCWPAIRLYYGFCTPGFEAINLKLTIKAVDGDNIPAKLKRAVAQLDPAKWDEIKNSTLLKDISVTNAIFILRELNGRSPQNLLKLLYLLSKVHQAHDEFKVITFTPVENKKLFASFLNETRHDIVR